VTIDRAKAMAAIDAAFNDGITRTFAVLVQGLIVDGNRDELTARFARGFAHHCDAHDKATAVVNDYFNGVKP
jgi:hypothetical protein